MNSILMEDKISPKVARARGSIDSQKAKQLMLHLWMYQKSARKKNNGSEESRRKQLPRQQLPRNKPGLHFIVGFFIVRNECLLDMITLRHLLLCFVEVRFFPFVLSFVEDLVCILSRLGVLLFRWPAAFRVDTFLYEGLTCL